LVLGLALAAPAASAAMGGAGGAASGTGGNAEAAHRPNGQTELTTCAQGMVWNTKDQRCLARHGGVRPGPRADWAPFVVVKGAVRRKAGVPL